MREIVIDASGWLSGEDFMNGVLEGLDPPHWHGRNWSALRDSVIAGGVNGVEPPYRLCLVGNRPPPEELREWIRDLVEMVDEARRSGRDIEITVASGLRVLS